MSVSYLTEAPSKKDIFKSRSHQRVADAAIDIFETNNEINIIGLEGGLGSGKSTVIELIKNSERCSAYKFFVFDVEQYHAFSIKKAFITLFSEWIIDFLKKGRRKHVEIARDKALGKVFEYTKENSSGISWWTVGFIISLVFSVASLRPLVSSFDEYFRIEDIQFFTIENCIWLMFLFSPLILLLSLKLYSKANKEDVKKNLIPTVGDIFKRNTLDRVTEKIEIAREVGSIELRESMRVFMESISDDVKCVLVIDNLDRVTSDKVKEVWSDLQVFIEEANERFKILLPFSRKHIAEALSENDGYEFIGKRIPIFLRVPPIVSVGWQEAFSKFYLQANPNSDPSSIKACSYILNVLLPDDCDGQVTPRLMKRYINDIASLISVTPLDVHPAVAAFYICALTYDTDNEYKVDTLIKQPPKNDVIRAVQKKLDQIVTNDNDWQIQIMCVHFQTDPSIAISEMLYQPLERAIQQADANAFIEKTDVYGFDDAVEQLIINSNYEDIIYLIGSLFSEEEEYAIEWVSKNSDLINHEIKHQLSSEKYTQDIDVLKTLNKILDYDAPLNVKPFERLYRDNINELRESDDDKEAKYEGLDSLYELSKIIRKIPDVVKHPTAFDYLNKLWDRRKEWDYWDIENIELSKPVVAIVIYSMFDGEAPEDLELVKNVISRIKLGWYDLSKSVDGLGKIQSQSFDKFIGNQDVVNGYVALIFDHRWYGQELAQQYIYQLNHVKDDAVRCELLAQCILNMVERNAYQELPQLKGAIEKCDDIETNLCLYFPLLGRFDLIFNALNIDIISEMVGHCVRDIIVNERVSRLNIDNIVKNKYGVLKEVMGDSEVLLSWLSAWFPNLNIENIDLDDFDSEFFVDVLRSSNQINLKKDIYAKIDNKDVDEQLWIEEITDTGNNFRSLMDIMSDEGYKLDFPSNLNGSIKSLFASNDYTDLLAGLNNPKLFNELIDLLHTDAVKRLCNELSKVLLTQSISNDVKSSLIVNLGECITLPVVRERIDQVIVRDLVCNLPVTDSVSSWFDQQEYYFDSWDKEDLHDLRNHILNNKEQYPRLYSIFNEL